MSVARPPVVVRRRQRPRWQVPPSLPSRPDPLYPLKIKIVLDLGLLEKVRREGWGGLTSAESGRVGGLMTKRLKGARQALRLRPGPARGMAGDAVNDMRAQTK